MKQTRLCLSSAIYVCLWLFLEINLPNTYIFCSLKPRPSHRVVLRRGSLYNPEKLTLQKLNRLSSFLQHGREICITNTTIKALPKVKRSPRPTALYSNSVVIFYPIIKLQHDIEVNPGPGSTTTQGTKTWKKNNVKIAHLNVRSLKQRDHFFQVKDTVQRNDFDVFTISETWLNCSVSDLEIEIPGYNVFRVDRQDKRGGGVCIYARQGFKTEVLHVISGISQTGLHQLWIKLQVRNFKSFLVCTTYHPPNVHTICFNTDLSSSLVAALLYNKPVYILGDLNCNLLDLNTPESQALIKFCQTFNLSQVVTKPTRLTDNLLSTLPPNSLKILRLHLGQSFIPSTTPTTNCLCLTYYSTMYSINTRQLKPSVYEAVQTLM